MPAPIGFKNPAISLGAITPSLPMHRMRASNRIADVAEDVAPVINVRSPGRVAESAAVGDFGGVRAQTIAAIDDAVARPGIIGRMGDAAMGIGSMVVNIPNVLASAVFLPLFVGGAVVSKIGDWTKVGIIKKTGRVLGAPTKWVTKSFNEVGQDLKIGRPTASITQKTANVLGKPADRAMGWMGLNKRFAGNNLAEAESHFANAKELAAKLDTAALPSELSHLDTVKQAVMSAKNPAELAHIETHVSDMVKVLGNKHPTIRLPKDAKVPEGALSLLESAGKASFHSERAGHWAAGKGLQSAPKSIGKASMGHTLWNSSFVGMSAMETLGVARGFGKNLGSLKQMYADIKGVNVKDVSTAKILFGSVPPVVKEARWHMFKRSGAEGAVQTAGLAFSIKQLRGGNFTKKAMAAQMGVAFGAGPLMALVDEGIAAHYKPMSDAYRGGQRFDAETYAQLLMAASPELKKHGATGEKFALALGSQYAAEAISPGQLLAEVDDGRMQKRIKTVAAAGDVAKASHPVEPRENGRKERPVVGAYTGKEAERMTQAAVPVRS